jgi:multiple sugar transport system permease protein
MKSNLELKIKHFYVYAIMIFLFLLAIVPIYVMLINSTRTTEEIASGLTLIPGNNTAYNWNAVTKRGFKIFQGFYNSAIIAFSSTILALYFSCMTAYGLHVYRFKGRLILWGLILIVMMLPASLSFIGFYQFMARMRLLDNFLPLILPAIASAGVVLFLRQYMSAVLSVELVDAARIDGANEFLIFNRIILPVITPAIAAQAIFSFVGSWNNFFTPFVLLSSARKYTLPMLVQTLRGDLYRVEMGGIYLGITVSIIPILIFYIFMSRFIISGLTLGGIKE